MEEQNMSLREFRIRFLRGEFDSHDVQTQIKAGWYDWFCKDSALAKKTKRLGGVVIQLQDSSKLSLDSMYVFFKNNCPLQGRLYDDFRICDMETHNVEFTVTYKSPHEEEGVYWAVYGRSNAFTLPLFTCRTARELVRWFND